MKRHVNSLVSPVLRSLGVGCVILFSSTVMAGDPADFGGLPDGDAQVEVYGVCSACHSLMIVQQQGLSEQSWRDTLDWMIEEQGMAQLPEDMLDRIAVYLGKHYGPDR